MTRLGSLRILLVTLVTTCIALWYPEPSAAPAVTSPFGNQGDEFSSSADWWTRMNQQYPTCGTAIQQHKQLTLEPFWDPASSWAVLGLSSRPGLLRHRLNSGCLRKELTKICRVPLVVTSGMNQSVAVCTHQYQIIERCFYRSSGSGQRQPMVDFNEWLAHCRRGPSTSSYLTYLAKQAPMKPEEVALLVLGQFA